MGYRTTVAQSLSSFLKRDGWKLEIEGTGVLCSKGSISYYFPGGWYGVVDTCPKSEPSRDDKIRAMSEGGESYQIIATRFGLTKGRVGQIMKGV